MSAEFAVVDSEQVFRGAIIGVRRDTITMPDGSTADREIVDHPGAVVILALDDDDQVVMVNQYRPALRRRLDELPAGLLDVAGEPALTAARRELAEEATLQATQWHTLLDLNTSPGFSDEAVRVFLARGLTPASRPDGFVVEHEESSMPVTRVPLDEAVRRAYAGEITNAAAVAGVLAAALGRNCGWAGLRPADAPWPSRPQR
jgi:8-oxo-dGTP pyrophosphatase MutT (NUDIX family)